MILGGAHTVVDLPPFKEPIAFIAAASLAHKLGSFLGSSNYLVLVAPLLLGSSLQIPLLLSRSVSDQTALNACGRQVFVWRRVPSREVTLDRVTVDQQILLLVLLEDCSALCLNLIIKLVFVLDSFYVGSRTKGVRLHTVDLRYSL